MVDSPAPADPRGRLKRRQCQSCGVVMPEGQLRQRDASGRYLCPHCVASGVQPTWAKSATAPETVAGHLAAAHGWDEERLATVHPDDLRDHHAELHDPRNGDVLAPATHQHQAARAGLRALAHESEDDSLLSHCPWDGSGQLIGSSDGTVTCGACGRSFTVRLQPSFPAMPQTDPTTGMPLAAPGGPDPSVGAMGGGMPPDPSAAPVGPSTGMPGQPPPPQDPQDPTRPPAMAAVHRLALRCSSDPAATLAQIIGERR